MLDMIETKTKTGAITMAVPVVWIANSAGHPYYKVLQLIPDAEIKPLTLDDANPLEVDRLCWHIARGIANYCSKSDYLLISGTPMVNAACFSLWLLHFGECNLIQWNASTRKYEKRFIELENLKRILEEQMTR